MDCRTLQNELISRAEVSPEADRHMSGCDNCRRFAADLQFIGKLCNTPVTTPAALSEHTLSRCHQLIEDQTTSRRMTVWQRRLRVIGSPQFIAGAAALAVMILGWWLATQIQDAQSSDSITSIKLAFVQVGIQNFGAALLFPLLWWMIAKRHQYRPLSEVRRTIS